MVKNPPAGAGDARDAGSIPGSGRSPRGGNDNPLQCSCLENPMDREAWRVQEWDTTEHIHATTEKQLGNINDLEKVFCV